MIQFNLNQNKSTSKENGEEKRAKKTKQTQNTHLISDVWTIGAKRPWPPSKCGPREKKAILTLDKFFWPPPQPKRGPLTIFRADPPLWPTSRRH